MQKKSLKVGEEYAVFRRPSDTRRYNDGYRSYNRGTPMRAKLVAIEGEISDTFTIRTTVYNAEQNKNVGTKDVEQTVSVKGIVVELLDEPFVAQRVPDVARVDTGYSRNHPLVPAFAISAPYRSYGSDEPEVGTHERSYTSIVLQNAGCFLSTWAEYEAEEIRHAEAKEKRKEEMVAQVASEKRRNPVNRQHLAALISYLTARGFNVKPEFLYDDERDKGDPYMYEVRSKDDPARSFRLNPRYTPHHDEQVLLSVEVERMDMNTLMQLLDSDRKEEVS